MKDRVQPKVTGGFIPAHGGYEAFLEKGGLRERMTRARLDRRNQQRRADQ